MAQPRIGGRPARHRVEGNERARQKRQDVGAFVGSGELAEQTNKRPPFSRCERRQHGVLDVIEHAVQALECASTALRKGDDVATPVRWIRLALRESRRHQVIQRGDDIALVDSRVSSKIRLTGGAVLVESGQQPEVIAAETCASEGIRQ